MQPHMWQKIKAQRTSWGQGCSSIFVVNPFHSRVIPLHSGSLCSCSICTWHSGRLSVKTGILYSDTHNSDSRGSSQTFPVSSLENPWSSEVHNLRPQTSVHSSFTRELYCLLGIKLASSTAWHPQTDRQMKRINQELDQYLCLFVNKQQDNWYNLLPMVEF